MAKHTKKTQAPAPSFNDAALSKLTETIDKNLSKTNGKSHRGKRKRNGGDEAERDSRPSKRQEPRQERVKKHKPDSQPKESKESKLSVLLEEIKALGGDEADLELVAGIDSDAEEGAGPAPERAVDDAFHAELAKFAAGLGFDEVRDEAFESSEPDEDAQDEDDEDEGVEVGDEEDEEEEEEPPAAKPSAAPEKVRPEKVRPEKDHSEKTRPAGKLGNLIFEPRSDWHVENPGDLPSPARESNKRVGVAITNLKSYASELLDADAAAYRAAVSSSSSHRFMSTMLSSGTMSDKVSALTLEIQESPVHNIKAFESLLGLASKKSRGQAKAALEALVDLLGNGVVLPNDRRLRTFQAQPGLIGVLETRSISSWTSGQKLPRGLTKAHLIMWAFEDWLKDAYFRLVQLLEVWSGDEIEYSRSRALDFIFGLLKNKPEQEANLLRLVVNKLGDRERKIASRASYLILQLLNVHPGMKEIVIRSVEQEVLLRPGQGIRAKYYAINTLNQTILSSKEPAIADTLVRIYFELFVSLLKSGALGAIDMPTSDKLAPEDSEKSTKKKQHDRRAEEKSGSDRDTAEKLVSAVLTGVNRAIPFAMTDESTLEKHLDTLFRITHSSNFNTSIQALMLIQQVATTKQLAAERFYRTLYESLLDPRLVTSSKQALYLNLLFRALKNDVDGRRVKAFVKRMLQIVNLHQPSFTCGILFLIAELENTFPDLKTLINEPEDDDDDEAMDGPDGSSHAGTNGNTDQPLSTHRSTRYDGRKRDPEYSNAQQSCLWELVPYLVHFHPSVAAFASNLLVRQASLPKPDLANHTLMHFLDKFVYRNPKAAETKRGASIMQPVLAAGTSAHIVAPGKEAAKNQQSLNSAAFWNKKVEDVAAEDVFFHEYFSQVGKPGKAAQTKKAKKETDGDQSGSEAEDEIWQALVDSRPDIQGDDDADVDLDMSEDDAELASLLNMSDSDEDDEEEGDLDVDMEDDVASQASDGAVEFFDFSDEDASDDDDAGPAAKTGAKGGRMRKRELKALPTFASVDDYAAMLGADDDEDY